jgi:signal transduction histidine kinase
LLLLCVHATVSALLPKGYSLAAFGDLTQTILLLLAVAAMLLNVSRTRGSARLFWLLLAAGCALWAVGQSLWVWFEVVLRRDVPDPFWGDALFFLHVVPFMAALGLQPHTQQDSRQVRLRSLDLLLLLLWWVYLYFFIVIPWQYVFPDAGLYGSAITVLYMVENMVLLVGLGVMWLRTAGPWRKVYAQLFLASFVYMMSSELINTALRRHTYYTGSVYDIPLVASMCWIVWAGLYARQLSPATEPASPESGEQRVWGPRLALLALLSLPLLAVVALADTGTPPMVRNFRLLLTLGALPVLTFLVFFKQHLLDAELMRLLRQSRDSYDNLHRLQRELLHSEKLASLGQLVAGAAHEINNPLTAILGYSEMLAGEAAPGSDTQGMARKIVQQALRTRALVENLLSFAKQVPAETRLLDVNAVVEKAVQLRRPEAALQNIRTELALASGLPQVLADENQLLQVFLHIIHNALDAMQPAGGVLTVRSGRQNGHVMLEFSDTGPGVKEPDRIFDPFYTTKAVGKGAGLGLSACYGILSEYRGRITCLNRPEGGATFQIILPVAPAEPAKTSGAAEPAR